MTLPNGVILDKIGLKCRDCVHAICFVDDDLVNIECYVYERDLIKDPVDLDPCKFYVSHSRPKKMSRPSQKSTCPCRS